MIGDNRDELDGTRCFCGGKKKSGMSVRFSCWTKLPARIKKALYEPLGYDDAFDAAKNFLRVRVAIPPRF